jgi:adenine/guanine phosphoribosyltransferase-like PRPP-binding protein
VKRESRHEWSHADYLEFLIPTSELKKSLRIAVEILSNYKFDAIAFRGMSGALLGPALAVRLNKSMLLVRKKDDSHSGRMVEGDKKTRVYVIVDDFMAGGETARKIVEEVKFFNSEARCLGILEIRNIRKNKSFGFTEAGCERWQRKVEGKKQ